MSAHYSEIENFFALWFSSRDIEQYSHLINSLINNKHFSDSVRLTDDEIRDSLQNIKLDNVLELDVFTINRIFLHILIEPIEEWSEYFKSFKHLIIQICQFIRENFQQKRSLRISNLKETSYPHQLLNCIELILNSYSQQIYPLPLFSFNLLFSTSYQVHQALIKYFSDTATLDAYILRMTAPQKIILFKALIKASSYLTGSDSLITVNFIARNGYVYRDADILHDAIEANNKVLIGYLVERGISYPSMVKDAIQYCPQNTQLHEYISVIPRHCVYATALEDALKTDNPLMVSKLIDFGLPIPENALTDAIKRKFPLVVRRLLQNLSCDENILQDALDYFPEAVRQILSKLETISSIFFDHIILRAPMSLDTLIEKPCFKQYIEHGSLNDFLPLVDALLKYPPCPRIVKRETIEMIIEKVCALLEIRKTLLLLVLLKNKAAALENDEILNRFPFEIFIMIASQLCPAKLSNWSIAKTSHQIVNDEEISLDSVKLISDLKQLRVNFDTEKLKAEQIIDGGLFGGRRPAGRPWPPRRTRQGPPNYALIIGPRTTIDNNF